MIEMIDLKPESRFYPECEEMSNMLKNHANWPIKGEILFRNVNLIYQTQSGTLQQLTPRPIPNPRLQRRILREYKNPKRLLRYLPII